MVRVTPPNDTGREVASGTAAELAGHACGPLRAVASGRRDPPSDPRPRDGWHTRGPPLQFGLFIPQGWRHDLVGIGAGWYEHEWRAYGYGFPSAGERLEALREGVEIMREMWTTGRSTHTGEHFTTDGALCFPKPLQGDSAPGSPRNGIPMWVAGGGEKKTLRIA